MRAGARTAARGAGQRSRRLAALVLLLAGCGGAPAAASPDLPALPDSGTTMHVSAIGAPCATNGDCKSLPSGTCWTSPLGGGGIQLSFPSGYCIEFCTTTADCPPDAACILAPNGAFGACLRRCDASSECRTADGYCCLADPLSANTAFCGSIDSAHQGFCAP